MPLLGVSCRAGRDGQARPARRSGKPGQPLKDAISAGSVHAEVEEGDKVTEPPSTDQARREEADAVEGGHERSAAS